MIRLRTASWSLEFNRTVERVVDGVKTDKKVDMWFLLDDREIDPETEDLVLISVPHGRQDIARFIARAVWAGQKVIQGLPLGHRMIPDEQPGFEKEEEPIDGVSR
jgi:hypothetical protein